MVMTWEDDPAIADGTTLLAPQSHRVTADGMLHARDGINYLFVSRVVEDAGIVLRSHEDCGVIPDFAIPPPVRP